MTWIDIVIVTVIALSTLVSLFRGVVKELLSLAVWVLSFWLAFHYFYPVSGLFEELIPYQNARIGAAFLLILITAMVAGMLLTGLMTRLVQASGMGATDRMLGGFFGLLRGIVVVGVAIMLAALTPLAQDTAWNDSLLIGYFDALSAWVTGDLVGEIGA